MKRRTTLIVTVLAFMVGIACGRLIPRSSSVKSTYISLIKREHVVAVIEAKVPGTRVFHRGQLLGEVPLEITTEKLAELGPAFALSSQTTRLDHDGWGEALIFGEMDEIEMKLMLQVPETDASHFLNIETPWGRRTKMGKWEGPDESDGPRRVIAHFMESQTIDGIRFRITVPERSKKGMKSIIELSCENFGRGPVTGGRPEYTLLWGGFDTPWRRRVCHKNLVLPPEWESIAPGQTVRTSLEIDAPQVAGDYSIFAVLGYNEAERGANRKLEGTYSDSQLFRVR